MLGLLNYSVYQNLTKAFFPGSSTSRSLVKENKESWYKVDCLFFSSVSLYALETMACYLILELLECFKKCKDQSLFVYLSAVHI